LYVVFSLYSLSSGIRVSFELVDEVLSGLLEDALNSFRPKFQFAAFLLCCLLFLDASREASAHDVSLPLNELDISARRIYKTLAYLRSRPINVERKTSAEEYRRALGTAGIEKSMNNPKRALAILMSRINENEFKSLPQYVDALLMASELLETSDEHIGAMTYAEEALRLGGSPEQMAEAGARWFRGARRTELLSQRLNTFELWSKRRQQAKRDGTEGLDDSSIYEIAYALTKNGEHKQARTMLSKISSSSPYGSRAAYLVGVSFIESGDLQNAERWFQAIMKWPIPAYATEESTQKMEQSVRELASLATGRLRYERGALAEAAKAYKAVTVESDLYGQVCYEMAFLNLERKRKRGALLNIQCAKELGVGGKRSIDLVVLQASLLAHLGQYGDSVDEYEKLEREMLRLERIARETIENIQDPMQFLFGSMERNAVVDGDHASPGPPIFFGDLWDADISQLYRLHYVTKSAAETVKVFDKAIRQVELRLEEGDVFPDIVIRRQHFRILLRDIQHLQGHAADMSMGLRKHLGDSEQSFASLQGSHQKELEYSLSLESRLKDWAAITEAEMKKLDDMENRVQSKIAGKVQQIRDKNEKATIEIRTLERQVNTIGKKISKDALERMLAGFKDGVMRARVGVLDTYWVRKEHVSKQIEKLLNKKDALNKTYEAALNSMK